MSWTKLVGASGSITSAESVAVDGSGNIYVVGDTKGNLDGQTKTGDKDAWISKYDSSGDRLNFFFVLKCLDPLQHFQGPGSGPNSKVVLAPPALLITVVMPEGSQLTAAAIASPWSASLGWRSTDRPTQIQALAMMTSSLFCSPPMGAPRGRKCLAAQEALIPMDTVLLSTAATTFTQWDTRSAVPSTDKL